MLQTMIDKKPHLFELFPKEEFNSSSIVCWENRPSCHSLSFRCSLGMVTACFSTYAAHACGNACMGLDLFNEGVLALDLIDEPRQVGRIVFHHGIDCLAPMFPKGQPNVQMGIFAASWASQPGQSIL